MVIDIEKINPQYLCRINRVLDYIERNIERPFTLAELAEVSGFSPYHFSRIFSGVMGETLFGYIKRLQLEKAKSWLAAMPQKSITDIALDFGFNDSSDFARAFKRAYGVSATSYRKKSKQSQDRYSKSLYNGEKQKKRSDDAMKLDYQVEVKPLEAMETMYLRHIGTFEELAKNFQRMIGKLFVYGQKNRLLNENTKLLAVYHDNPNITRDEDRRTSVCLSVPEGTKVEGEFGQMTIPAGKYAIGHFALDNAEQCAKAWEVMFGEWLPQSGYQPGDGAVFEAYLNDPNTHPQKKHLIDIHVPVKPL